MSPGMENTYYLALQQYDQKNYDAAYELFNKIPEESPPNKYYYLYKGATAMELEDFQVAVRSFTYLLADPVQKQESLWYLGLSYLALENIPAAKKAFQEIIETDGHYKKEAKKILKNI